MRFRNHFRFRNGARETSLEAVKIAVTIAGRAGTIKASLVQGRAPLLISRNAMKALSAKMDFAANELHVFEDQRVVPLETNSAGQYVIQLMGNPSSAESQFDEVMVSEQVVVDSDNLAASEPPAAESSKAKHLPDAVNSCASESEVLSKAVPGQVPSGVSVWSRVDVKLRWAPLSGKQGPYWHQVICRVVTDLDTQQIILDQPINYKP